jgi:hypothetical protein
MARLNVTDSWKVFDRLGLGDQAFDRLGGTGIIDDLISAKSFEPSAFCSEMATKRTACDLHIDATDTLVYNPYFDRNCLTRRHMARQNFGPATRLWSDVSSN